MEKDTGLKISELRVDGGASRDGFLMQFQADVLGRTVRRGAVCETTALGAAYLAGLACGYWKSREEIQANWQLGREFVHEMSESSRGQLLKGWKRAVRCALAWAQEEGEE